MKRPKGYDPKLTTKEVAEISGRSEFWWRSRRSKGTSPIPFIKLGTAKQSRCLYRLQDLQDYMDARTFTSTADAMQDGEQ